ncbi:hypothetical protein KIW84_055049 [Lathyrus oleraceus]|uniref:Tubulin-folding cofactor D C-terminal domain-containing protein n=1 Tax=Pisum sativum TaxID=3888 RepID=A0A9D5AFB4_PEA|nr:hypothetical protein KIW84_055049 [Pisum sativum]
MPTPSISLTGAKSSILISATEHRDTMTPAFERRDTSLSSTQTEWAAKSGTLSHFVANLGSLVEIRLEDTKKSLKRVSLLTLLEYLEGIESKDPNTTTPREYMLSVDILWVLQQYRKDDRVIVPTLKVCWYEGLENILYVLEALVPCFKSTPTMQI